MSKYRPLGKQEQHDAQEITFAGKTLKEALRDQQSQAMTGYKYAELVEIVKDEENEDMLFIDELDDVDRSVNMLAHLFVYFARQGVSEP